MIDPPAPGGDVPEMDDDSHSAEDHNYYLGVDGGGSKTLAVIVDEYGEVWGSGQAGSSNHEAVGLQQALFAINTAITKAFHPLNGQRGQPVRLRRAWLGLAGVDRPADYDALRPHLAPLAEAVRITNDAELLLSVLDDAVGVALIAGTGSIALGRNAQGQTARTGGWGHILGDEGSGYALGLHCLKAVTRAADGRGPHTLLLKGVLAQWGLQGAEDIIGQVYHERDKAKIARLSSLVLQAARQGDAVAQGIVQREANELAQLVTTVCARLGYTPTQDIPLALGGGLLLHESHYRLQVLAYIRDRQSIADAVMVQEPALSAARAIIHLSPDNNWMQS